MVALGAQPGGGGGADPGAAIGGEDDAWFGHEAGPSIDSEMDHHIPCR
ncbi:hypothetical protein ABT247_03930 [Kitasatospora sp. NPDC001539]